MHRDVKKFARIEEELSLFEREYNGFHYWQYIRFYVYNSLFGTMMSIKRETVKSTHSNIFRLIVEFFGGIFETLRLYFHLVVGARCDILFLKYGKLSDKFFDTWNLPSNIKSKSIRVTSVSDVCDKKDLILDWPRIKSGLLDIGYRFFHINRIDEKESAFIKLLVKRLVDEFGQCDNPDLIERLIHFCYLKDYNYSKAYKLIFNKIKCKAILFECYYSESIIPAIKVASEMGILSIEMQHGVINYHESYWFEDGDKRFNYTPNIFLIFGETHRKYIKLQNDTKINVVGFPYQEKSINELQIETNDKEIVIYPEPYKEFECILDLFIDRVTKQGYSVYLKLHPLQSSNYDTWYPILSKNKRLKIITSQNNSIYYWLKRARHHIMANTTVGLESVAFDNLNVCIAKKIPHDQLQYLIDTGIAREFTDVEELVYMIQNPISINKEYLLNVRDGLWSENATQNMERFFCNLHQMNYKV